MTFVAGDWGKAVANFTLPLEVKAKMVFYFTKAYANPTSDVLITTAVGSWITLMWEELTTFIADAVTLDTVDVYKGTVAPPGESPEYTYVGTYLSGVSGESTADLAPHGVAAVVIALTEVARVVARKFWPGWAETAIGLFGAWTSSVLSDLTLMYARWTSMFNYLGEADINGDMMAGVYSKKLGAFKTFVWPGAISNIPGYQRRRKPGVGI